MCAKCASAMKILILDVPSTAKSYKKKRRGEAEKREKERGEREMTTIETFDFVKEVTLTGDANRVLYQRRFLKFSK